MFRRKTEDVQEEYQQSASIKLVELQYFVGRLLVAEGLLYKNSNQDVIETFKLYVESREQAKKEREFRDLARSEAIKVIHEHLTKQETGGKK